MTNALNFFRPYNLFDFGNMPIWFDDFGIIPLYFTNSPKVNVKETDKAYEIEIANPGFTKDDTDTEIEVKDHVIYVSMNLKSESKNDEKYHIRTKSSYEESWNLPKNVIEDQISAKYVDSVLIITLPKKEETKQLNNQRTIKIE